MQDQKKRDAQRPTSVSEAPTADEAMGIAWWNGLDDAQRKDWMARAGNTGIAADAWAVFKSHSPN